MNGTGVYTRKDTPEKRQSMSDSLTKRIEKIEKALEELEAKHPNDYQITIYGWQDANFEKYNYPPTPEEIAYCQKTGYKEIIRFAE